MDALTTKTLTVEPKIPTIIPFENHELQEKHQTFNKYIKSPAILRYNTRNKYTHIIQAVQHSMNHVFDDEGKSVNYGQLIKNRR